MDSDGCFSERLSNGNGVGDFEFFASRREDFSTDIQDYETSIELSIIHRDCEGSIIASAELTLEELEELSITILKFLNQMKNTTK